MDCMKKNIIIWLTLAICFVIWFAWNTRTEVVEYIVPDSFRGWYTIVFKAADGEPQKMVRGKHLFVIP